MSGLGSQVELVLRRRSLAQRITNAINARWRSVRHALQWGGVALTARHSPRHVPGVITLGDLTLSYTDLLSLYVEYKDIFRHRVYHFAASNDRPRIIDGGGCIGLSALYFKTIYPNAEVITFEPDLALADLIEANLERNGVKGVTVVRAGLSTSRGQVAFAPDGVDGGRIIDPIQDAEGKPALTPQSNQSEATIQTVPISDFLDRDVDFVKLNIEGQELPVLQEAVDSDTLRHVREMVIEYHGWPGGQQRLGAILNLLDHHHFRYLVHDFDAQTCATSKPPFNIRPQSPWFCLIYARQFPPPIRTLGRAA